LNDIWTWLLTYGPALVAALIVFVKAAQVVVDFFPKHQEADTIFGTILRVLETISGWFAPRQAKTLSVRRLPASLKVVVFGLLLLSTQARAQYFSGGASLPMLEFVTKGGQPVSFSPGVGVEGSVGWFQTNILGRQWDLLDLSLQAFGNYPGAFQVAALVGTLNNLIGFGVAVPLTSADGTGAFQGSFHAYPVLSFSIPFATTTGTAVTAEQGVATLPRGGTWYAW
jgi:hypothetical protein